jgi:hypothetical protein
LLRNFPGGYSIERSSPLRFGTLEEGDDSRDDEYAGQCE